MSDIWADAKRTRVWENVDAETFRRDIRPRNEPAILKGVATHWPLIAKSKESPRALADYVRSLSAGQPIEAFFGAPGLDGRYTYGGDLKSFNFERRPTTLAALLDLMLTHIDDANPPSFYAGAVNIPQHLPRLATDNPLDLIDPAHDLLVSLWLGNRSRTAAHWDLPQNIACVISGRRRYTMLPTEQVKNLYLGPLDFTLAGRATSLVDFHNPDFDAHPRFREAMAAAEVADLEPGDAVYVPSLWFHHVDTLDPFGMMMNFWWREAPDYMIAPTLTLFHAQLTLRDLPPEERAAWRVLFDHYVFQTAGDPFAHIPMDARGLFGEMTPEKLRRLKDLLARSLR